MSTRVKGILYTSIAAVIFGYTPILTRITYEGGSNGVTVTFLRAVLSLPILLAAMLVQGIPVRLSKQQVRNVLITGLPGFSLSIILLYCSYSYISVGMATTLHFIYPLLVALGGVLFFKERLNRYKVMALVAGTVGILFFLERSSGPVSILGVVLSLLSGVGYAFHVSYMDHSGLKDLHFFRLTFFLNIVMALSAGLYGIATSSLTFRLTPKAWVYSLLVSLLVSVVGLPLLQLGIRYVGATTASMLTTLEPVTSVVCGILILHESLSPLKLTGCILLFIAVFLISRAPEDSAPAGQDSEQYSEPSGE